MALRNVTIVGGGLAGSLMAYVMGKKGYNVTVTERRNDPRNNRYAGGKSINLVVSHRGWTALEYAGLADQIRPITVPAYGRQIHDLDGAQHFFPYSIKNEPIHSVSRGGLNIRMVELADELDNVSFLWNHKCIEIDANTGSSTYETPNGNSQLESDLIIGADGAFSAVRSQLTHFPRFNYSQNYIDSGYKEIHIPPAADGSAQINIEALHIWPRRQFMLMGLANLDNGFTGTVFAPFEGEDGLDNMPTAEDGMRYFEKYFPDAIPLIPNLKEQWEDNPTSALAIIRCEPWHWGSKVMLIGDAAHATVPFYGEGMNASFEDVRIFAELLDAKGDSDMEALLAEYSAIRKPHGDAVQDLSVRNFVEMRDLVADPKFQLRKKIERKVQALHPDKWTPLYSQVKFTDIQYADAMAEGERHDRIMEDILAIPGIDEKWDNPEIVDLVLEKLATQA